MGEPREPPFISGGYFLAHLAPRPEHVSTDLMPPRLLSACGHICDLMPSTWAVRWASVTAEERTRAFRAADFRAGDLEAVITWVTDRVDRNELGWPGAVFYSLADARSFVESFRPSTSELVLFGLELPRSYRDAFLREAAAEGTNASGVHCMVSRDELASAGGKVLGFDLLGYEYGGFCSWLCNGLEKTVFEALGMKPNEAGFVDTLADAERATAHFTAPGVGAEPVYWSPWRVTTYSLEG